MANRKQVSFVRGEVSPSFRFKSSSVGYAEGLYKLKNGYVRRGGGVSNRSGFAHLADLGDNAIEGKGRRSNTRLIGIETETNISPRFTGLKTTYNYFLRRLFFAQPDERRPSNKNAMRISDWILDILNVRNTPWWYLGGVGSAASYAFAKGIDSDTLINIYKLRSTQLQNGQALLSFSEGDPFNLDLTLNFEGLTDAYVGNQSVPFGEGFRLSADYVASPSRKYQYPKKEIIDDYFYLKAYKEDASGNPIPYADLPNFSHRVSVHVNHDINPLITGAYIVTCEYPNGDERIVFATEGPITSYQGGEATIYIGEFILQDAYRPGLSFNIFGPATPGNAITDGKRVPLRELPPSLQGLFSDRLGKDNLRDSQGDPYTLDTLFVSVLYDTTSQLRGQDHYPPPELPDRVKNAQVMLQASYQPDPNTRFVFPAGNMILVEGLDSGGAFTNPHKAYDVSMINHRDVSFSRPEGNIYKLYRAVNLNSPFSLVWVTRMEPGERLTERRADLRARAIVLKDPGVEIASTSIQDRLRLYGSSNAEEPPTFTENILYHPLPPTFLQQYTSSTYPSHEVPGVLSQGLFLPYLPKAENSNPISLYGRETAIRAASFGRSVVFQQRHFVSYTISGTKDSEQYRGVIGVSALNSYLSFSTGDDIDPVKAFEFNIPIEDSGKVVAMTASERLLIFTTEKAYLIAGNSDSGIITPTEVNPVTIYVGGCSEEVEPIRAENKVIFLNNDHSSIVSVEFGAGRGSGVRISETDGFAKHFLEKSIIQMAVTTSFETVVWLLREDGALISMTQFPDGVYGFGIHELSDGYVENIASTRLAPLYRPSIEEDSRWRVPDVETIAATIVRDRIDEDGTRIGQIRTLEAIVPRDDVHPEGMNYMDGMRTFGHRLTKNTEGRWVSTLATSDSLINNAPDSESIVEFNRLTELLAGFVDSVTDEDWVSFIRQLALHPIYMSSLSFVGGLTDTELLTRFPLTTLSELFDGSALVQGDKLISGYDAGEKAEVDSVKSNRRYINITVNPEGERSVSVQFFVTDGIASFIESNFSADNVTSLIQQQGLVLFFNRLFNDGIVYFGEEETVVFSNLSEKEQRDIRQFADGMFYLKKQTIPEEMAVYYGEGQRIVLSREGLDFAKSFPARFIDGEIKILSAPAAFPNFPQNEMVRGVSISVPYVVEAGTLPKELVGVLTPENLPPAGSIEEKERLGRASRWVPMTDTVTGLDHLKNKEVSVFADNEAIPNLKVDNEGVLKLPERFAWGSVGIPYEFEMESLQIDSKSERLIDGRKVVNVLVAALYRTAGGEMGSISEEEVDESDQTFPIYETAREQSVDKNGLFNGAIEQNLSSSWSVGGRVRIVQKEPKPITVNAIYPKGAESGGR